ncbi:MAG: hypothetical protein ACM3US_02410 [Sphingomonadaceae bacterium]
MNPTVIELVADLSRRGLILEVAGNKLKIRGPRPLLTPNVLEVLREHKPEIVRLLSQKEGTDGRNAAVDAAVSGPGAQPVAQPPQPLDPEVAWRVEIMRPQVPRTGPIPFLVARDVAPQPDCCLSCGDPLPEGRHYRCAPCQRAVEIVLNEVREGVR